ncbi:MFS transporter [Cochlodiniinecator piscidefendens]|uniref:MFS transporter n=1 Tax=Cochlodiniinecator piscidefendens TaxID=2715756 RepID=UPI00140B7063|nr:MFS transporter [Cochlodiniinecator piscidefendens]
MLNVLKNKRFRHLFLAQIVALLGTGLATVALGLLAYDIAGGQASLVLGGVFTIKMIAYVGIAPIAGAFADRVDRRKLLVGLDLIRAFVALALPFTTDVWQIFGLIFLLQAASAGFTPTFQATIPDVLPEEQDYTRALSLSRLAYDLESLITPTLAAILLTVFAYNALFLGTLVGFLGSALLIISIALPNPKPSAPRGIYDRTTRGIRIYLATPRLQGLLALCMTVAAVAAVVLVNTVVLVRSELGLNNSHVAYALGAFGGGSMIAAFALPKVLDHTTDRLVMISGSVLMVFALIGLALNGVTWTALLATWFFIGLGYSITLTPSGRLLQRSAHPEDRPAVYAAQFALSHACWLIAYPLSGWAQTTLGSTQTMIILAAIGAVSSIAAMRLWPTGQQREFLHTHDDLPADHPHLKGSDGNAHSHAYVIDEYHAFWPKKS